MVDDKLWAVERVQHGIYALCSLSKWVTLERLGRLQSKFWYRNSVQKRESAHQAPRSEDAWWRTAAIRPGHGVEERTSDSKAVRKNGDFPLCLQKPGQERLPPSPIARQIPSTIAQNAENCLETLINEVTQGPEDILRMISSQYQEALYASNVGFFCYSVTRQITDIVKDAISILCKRPTFSSTSCFPFVRWVCSRSIASYTVFEV